MTSPRPNSPVTTVLPIGNSDLPSLLNFFTSAGVQRYCPCRLQMIGHPLLARGRVRRLCGQLRADRFACGQARQGMLFAAPGNYRMRARRGGAFGGQDLGQHAAAASDRTAGAAGHSFKLRVSARASCTKLRGGVLARVRRYTGHVGRSG